MQNLNVILKLLREMKGRYTGEYYIPEFWNSTGYEEYTINPERVGEINVNPYDFMLHCMENHILSKGKQDAEYLNMEWDAENSGILGGAIYSMLPRMFTAWDHKEDGVLTGGTFLKAICLLPYLKSMGIDAIYLLPVFEYSDRYKKGELGCPYAIKNIYKLSSGLHDDLLGENGEELLNTEFKAFVEACHILGIKVMVDFVFRTVARDSDLIAEHPEWFYWIEKKYNNTFAIPPVEKEKKLTLLNDQSLKSLYTCSGIHAYLKQFTYSPVELDTEKWEKVMRRTRQNGEEALDVIEELYGITTVPGFSNVLNDPQPPWSDVTYPKFYLDMSREAKQYVKEGHPPYILQDGVSLNLYHGEAVNREFWDYVAGAIPFYQKQFGIDGARIDMGHALPEELNKEIIARTKAENKNFILWSEEFSPEKSKGAAASGFDFITGTLWQTYREIDKAGFTKKLFKMLACAHIPVTGALETPDTPRFSLVHSEKKKLEMLVFLNHLIPNAIPLINNGMEVLERQPMNLGLDNTEEGRFVLEKEDPMYGKLAFFDNYKLHWRNEDRVWMYQLLKKSLSTRKRFSGLLKDKESFDFETSMIKNKKLIFLCYFDKANLKNLCVIVNRDLNKRARINLKTILPTGIIGNTRFMQLAYAGGQSDAGTWEFDKTRLLEPGEVIVGYCE
ncbi:MAG: alpha-amylase family glycosyl hydrolase [Clostridia bacterium]|nr:alpha-amylase family glycosyl hydrolase [Clostridia bacterium]